MKRFCLILFLMLVAAVAAANTHTAQQAGNWSDATVVWHNDGGEDTHAVPANGDIADLNGFIIAMDITRIPAVSGSLLLLRSGVTNNSAGQLTVNLTTLGNCGLYATTIQTGTKPTIGGFILVTGNINTLTVVCSDLYGGTNDSTSGISKSTGSGIVLFYGNTHGHLGTQSYGVSNTVSTGFVTIIGNVYGGTGIMSSGLYTRYPATTFLIGNIIFESEKACPISGYSPIYNPAATNYITMPKTDGTQNFYYDIPADANVLEADTTAGVAGTYHAPELDEVVHTAVFGPSNSLTGHYYEPNFAYYKDGEFAGIDNLEEGSYAGGGGFFGPRIRIGH